MKQYMVVDCDQHSDIIYEERSEVQMKGQGGKYTSISPAFDTKEELIKNQGILDDPCKICGSVITTNFYEPTKSKLIEKNYCFSCNLWEERLQDLKKENVFIINGTFYTDAGIKSNSSFLGYGGRKFTILKENRAIIKTNNLWNGGNIPDVWRDKYIDNATFIPEAKIIL